MRHWITHNIRDNPLVGVALLHMLTGVLQWVIWSSAYGAIKDITESPGILPDVLFRPDAIPYFVLCLTLMGVLGGASVALHARFCFPLLTRRSIVEGMLIGALFLLGTGVWAFTSIAQRAGELYFAYHVVPGAVLAIEGLTLWIDYRLWRSYAIRSRIRFTRILKEFARYFGAFYGLQCLFWVLLIPIGIVTLGVVALIHSGLRVTTGLGNGYFWDALIGAAMGLIYFVGIQFIFSRLRPARDEK